LRPERRAGAGSATLNLQPLTGGRFPSETDLEGVDLAGADVSADWGGRSSENWFLERPCRRSEPENIYLQDYSGGFTTRQGLAPYKFAETSFIFLLIRRRFEIASARRGLP